MYTIDDVWNYVSGVLTKHCDTDDHDDIMYFLTALKTSKNWRCQKLVICIGIDLKTYEKKFTSTTVEIDDYAKFLIAIILETQRDPYKLKTSTNPSPSVKFGLHLRKNFDRCFPKISSNKSDGYFRVISFSGFIDRIVKDNFDFNIDELPTDFDFKQKDRYYEELKSGLRFAELEIKNIGSGNGWVYVGNRLDLNQEILDKDLSKILDSIGYYVENAVIKDTYICLDYPDSITETLYQPCTLTGDWGKINYVTDEEIPGNDFFICNKDENCWGRTFSVSGTLPEVKERAHRQYDFKREYKFKIIDLGELGSPLNVVASNEIIKKALDRYKDAF